MPAAHCRLPSLIARYSAYDTVQGIQSRVASGAHLGTSAMQVRLSLRGSGLPTKHQDPLSCSRNLAIIVHSCVQAAGQRRIPILSGHGMLLSRGDALCGGPGVGGGRAAAPKMVHSAPFLAQRHGSHDVADLQCRAGGCEGGRLQTNKCLTTVQVVQGLAGSLAQAHHSPPGQN